MKKLSLFVFVFLLVIYSNCLATIHLVESVETDISSVIFETEPGDTVILTPGTYSQRIQITEHAITLASQDILDTTSTTYRDITIIDGENLIINGNPLLDIGTDDEHFNYIYGLTFQNMDNYAYEEWVDAAAINSVDSNIEVRNCSFYNNTSFGGSAVKIEGGRAIIRDCHISDNEAAFCGGIKAGLCLIDIIGCVIENNSTLRMDGGGIGLFCASGKITDNLIRNNFAQFWGAGLLIGYCSNVLVKNNVFSENLAWDDGGAIKVLICDSLKVIGNIFSKNVSSILDPDSLHYRSGAAISFRGSTSYGLISNNTFIKNSSVGLVNICVDNTVIKNNMFIGNQGFRYALFETYGLMQNPIHVEVDHNAFKYTGKYEGHESRYEGGLTAIGWALLEMNSNDFIGNEQYAVGPRSGYGQQGEFELNGNYWGDPTGPFHASQNPGGLGDTLHTDINLGTFVTQPNWLYGLEFESDEFVFGNIELGYQITEPILLRNVSARTLTVNHLAFTDNEVFSIPDIDSLTLEPGESVSIPVTFAPLEGKNYNSVLATVSTQALATGTTIEIFGNGFTDVNEKPGEPLPASFQVSAPYPNPFNSQTRISVYLPEAGNLDFAVYDINGRLVKQVTSGIHQNGISNFNLNLHGQASGIYFAHINAGNQVVTKKLLLIQ